MTPIPDAAPRIALIHALEESVLPARTAFAAHWPEAKPSTCSTPRSPPISRRAGASTMAMTERFLTLGRYAAATEATSGPARAILFTCSAFGPAIDAVKRALPIPVLRPNESAFAEALALGGRIGLMVTFAPSLPSLTQEIREMAGGPVEVTGVMVEGALAALKAGDGATHDRLAAEAAAKLSGIDTLILGHSRSPAPGPPSRRRPGFAS